MVQTKWSQGMRTAARAGSRQVGVPINEGGGNHRPSETSALRSWRRRDSGRLVPGSRTCFLR